MTLTSWSPVRDLAGLEIDRLNRMFDAAFTGASASAFVPAVDIFETSGQDVVVKVDLPGTKREDIKVTFENNVLTIDGERKSESAEGDDRFQRIERAAGTFRRSFTLPATIDGSRVSAGYADGVLTVTLPRREETRPRQIQVNG
jgi:HSP20 family protein